MAVNLSPVAGAAQQFFDNNGVILSGGKLYTYVAGTTTPLASYTSSGGATPHANPIVLDSAGRVPGGEIWITNTASYKFVLETANGILLGTFDDISAVATISSDVSYTPPFTGGVERSLFEVSREYLSAFDFMTAAEIADVRGGTLGIDVTTKLQTAINAAASTGQTLHLPAGNYLTGALVMTNNDAGRCVIDMDPKATLSASTANITVITMGEDGSRQGPRIIRGGRIDGRSLANVIGIRLGGDVEASLYHRLQDLYITACDTGVITRNTQELICDGLICYANRVGFVAYSTSGGGGSTVLQFYGCRFQDNRVNFFGKSGGVFPVGGWLFSGCTFQTGRISGMALYGAVGGNGVLTSITLDNCHFEASGFGTSPGDTETVEGEAVPRSNIYIAGSRARFTSGELGASLLSTSFMLRTGAVVTVSDGVVGGGQITQFDCDATSQVVLEGQNAITGSATNIVGWDGFQWTGGSGGCFTGTPLIARSPSPGNQYTAGYPNAPALTNAIGAVVSAPTDNLYGLVSRAAFLAAVGSSGTNRVIIPALPMAFSTGDKAVCTFLVKASAATTVVFQMQGGAGALATVSTPLRVGWQRVVIYGAAAAAEASGFELYVYPTDAVGATVDFANIMSVKSLAADTYDTINSIIRFGWYDDLVSPIYNTAAPTTGTWARGKQVINSAPTVGQPKGWTCTVSGSPGTWVSQGNL